jgi:hypothetical protein
LDLQLFSTQFSDDIYIFSQRWNNVSHIHIPIQNVEHPSGLNPAAGMKTVWSLPTVTTREITLGTAAFRKISTGHCSSSPVGWEMCVYKKKQMRVKLN